MKALDVTDDRVEWSGSRRSVTIEDGAHVFAKDEGVPSRVESGGERSPSIDVSQVIKWRSYATSIKIQLRISKITKVSMSHVRGDTNHPCVPFSVEEFAEYGEKDVARCRSSECALS